MKVVWVTGASSGLGFYTAKALARAGYTVVAGARSFSECEGESETGFRLALDVRDEASCDRFCRLALAEFGAPWALVNAAGVLTLGACETCAVDAIRDVMDTNFFGCVRMTQRALPLMRAAGEGRIVNFSSINGLLGIPFQGAYVASKHAIEGFSECLAAETRPFGISLMLVEPGDHRGGSQRCRKHAESEHSPYRAAYEKATAAIAYDEAHGKDPGALAEKVVRALGKKRMPLRLRVASWDQHLAAAAHKFVPAGVFNRVIGWYYCGRK